MTQTVKHLSAMQETRLDPWVGKIPWRRKWQPTPIPLPGKSHGWRILVGYNPWGRKESDTTERLNWTDNEWWWASFQVLAISMSSLEKCLFSSLAHFLLDRLFFWNWAIGVACIFLRLVVCQLLHLLLFSPILKSVFSPCLQFPLLCRSF